MKKRKNHKCIICKKIKICIYAGRKCNSCYKKQYHKDNRDKLLPIINKRSRKYNKNPKRQEYMRKRHQTKAWKKYSKEYSRKWRKRPENINYSKIRSRRYYIKNRLILRKTARTINSRWAYTKYSAFSRELRFDISKKKYKSLIEQGCHYCKKDLTVEVGIGLDRINNKFGYSLKNVLPCCGVCNKIRNKHLTVEEMEVVIKSLLRFRKKKILNWSVTDK